MRPGLEMTSLGPWPVVCGLSLALAGCATAPKPPAPALEPAQGMPHLEVSQVGVEPKTIDARTGETAAIRYEMNRPAAVSIALVDEEGRTVRRIDAGPQGAGRQAVTWDGRDAQGEEVPGGVYRYVILAEDAQGRQSVYDPSAGAGGEELEPRGFTFDRETGTLRWVMPKAGYVRLRTGLEGFPHLRTLLDWAPTEWGEQTAHWDGRDGSGLIRFKDHPQLSIKLAAFSMPPNAIIVRGVPQRSAPSVSPRGVQGDDGRRYLHARHPRAACRELSLRVEFPENPRAGTDGLPVLSGAVPVRVVLDGYGEDPLHRVNQRFEVAFYEDLTFLFEAEEGSNPFTYLWDTSHLAPGEHLLTVNIMSYDDHYGVETCPVLIQEAA